jgi:hypothetical protein
MPDLIQLLTLESDKLMMAASPHLRHRLHGRIRMVLQEPGLTPALVTEAMKKVQRELDLSLKSHPDAKNAMVAVLIVFCVLLRNEARAMVHLAHASHGHRQSDLMAGHLNNVFRLASMLQPLLKTANAHQTKTLQEALRRIH